MAKAANGVMALAYRRRRRNQRRMLAAASYRAKSGGNENQLAAWRKLSVDRWRNPRQLAGGQSENIENAAKRLSAKRQ